MPLLLLAGGVALFGGGHFLDKAGEGANDASNAAIKLAVVGGIGYFIAKKQGWL